MSDTVNPDEGFVEFVEGDVLDAEVVDAEVVDEEVIVEPVEIVEPVVEEVVVDEPVVEAVAEEVTVDAPTAAAVTADTIADTATSAVNTVTGAAKSLIEKGSISSFDEAATFIGPNADYYIPRFQQIEASDSPISWNWAAFLFGIFWMLYRKMWLYALIIWGATLLLTLVTGGLGSFAWLLESVAFGVLGNWLYKKHVETELEKAAPLDPAARKAQLATRGGITWLPVIVVAVVSLIAILGICGLMSLAGLGSIADSL